MTPATFCKCGAGVCGNICCKTEQDPKTCDGVWNGGISLWNKKNVSIISRKRKTFIKEGGSLIRIATEILFTNAQLMC